MSETVFLSVLVPVYNEEESLPSLGRELHDALSALGRTYEVVLVDDGSTDGTWELLKDLAKTRPGFRAVRLGRNSGQTAALAAGIRHAKGELISCLDADLQNDPRDIALLLRKLDEGFDVVSGWRRDRQDAYLTRVLPSHLANRLISWITGVPLHDYGCTLKLYRAQYLKSLRLYGEMHRFVPAFAGFLGARIAEVPVNHRPRVHGSSKYGLSRTVKVLLDLLTVKFMDAYMGKPIYLFGGGGLLSCAAGVAAASYTVHHKFSHGVFIKDQPLFQVSIFLLMLGFQLILLGLLAEILVRVYFDIKDKPTYFVRETAGFPTGSAIDTPVIRN